MTDDHEGKMTPISIADLPDDIERALVWGERSLVQKFDEPIEDRDWYTASWLGEKWGSYWIADGEGFINGVTHWMPLPPPPPT